MRAVAFIVAFVIALAHAGTAFAHASLVRAEPADGAMLADAPKVLRLIFNEPVSPLVLRLMTSEGKQVTPAAKAENTTITVTPPPLPRGTHVLSWRVVSADGHPVGGSLMFSVGEATAPPAAGTSTADRLVGSVLWATKLVIYAALFVGIGGAFFRAWMTDGPPHWLDRILVGLIVAGLFATALSVGLQGLDALDLRLMSLASLETWEAGLHTSYGLTAISLAFALFAGLFSFAVAGTAARALALVAIALTGLALSLSGHASNATPQTLTRPSVFVHVVCVAFWIGALAPLAVSVAGGNVRPLARFTRAIPYLLAALVLSGTILALRQLDRVDALWTTSYGLVLAGKLMAVAMLVALAAVNRYVLTPRYQTGSMAAARSLMRTMVIELGIACAIFALAASWRFTPPPRALAAWPPFDVHLHGERAMAHITLTPVRARDPRVTVEVFDGAFNPLAVKEVTLTLANPAAGIEPVRHAVVGGAEAAWRVENLRIPVAGRWNVRIDLLIDDFEKLTLQDDVELPRLP